MTHPDAVVVGSGPNGLAAAVALAESGASVVVLERHHEVGGGTRSAELTLPGFIHDVCSAVHPMGVLSPFFRRLPLEEHGLRWIRPAASVAHPLDDAPAVLLHRSVAETADELGVDAASYRRLVEPFLGRPDALLSDALAPLHVPRHPGLMLRFGMLGMRSASGLARRFRGPPARALLAGCASHSILPLDRTFSAAVGLMFLLAGHFDDWPVAAGGSQAIANALASLLVSLGGQIETNRDVNSLADLPAAPRVWLFDTAPSSWRTSPGPRCQMLIFAASADIATARVCSNSTGHSTARFPRAIPVVCKRRRCTSGARMKKSRPPRPAVWRGDHPERPFVLVCQQSEFDPARSPAGKHTGWAYCHVPPSSTVDLTDIVERQIKHLRLDFAVAS